MGDRVKTTTKPSFGKNKKFQANALKKMVTEVPPVTKETGQRPFGP